MAGRPRRIAAPKGEQLKTQPQSMPSFPTAANAGAFIRNWIAQRNAKAQPAPVTPAPKRKRTPGNDYAAGVAAERQRFAAILKIAGGDAALAAESFLAGHDKTKAALHIIPHLERRVAQQRFTNSEACAAMLANQPNGHDPVAAHASVGNDSTATGNLATSLTPAQQKVAAAIVMPAPEQKSWLGGWLTGNQQK
jgi:hypothetical protein